jgi:hypothetical protein
MFSVKISSVKGISISKTRLEFFNLKRFGDAESKIQAHIVNVRIQKFHKKFQCRKENMQSSMSSTCDHMQRRDERARSAQIIPSFIRPASLIIF